MKRKACVVAALAVLAGCTSRAFGPQATGGFVPQGQRAGHFDHIVILVQENRTFDNLFATYPFADGTKTGKLSNGGTVALHETNMSDYGYPHAHGDFLAEYDHGKMDGWFNILKGGGGQYGPSGTLSYQYVYPDQITPYWAIAKRYVLADHTFPTQSSGSYTGHLDLIGPGTQFAPGKSVTDFPTGSPFPQYGCDLAPGTRTSLLTLANWAPGSGANYHRLAGPFTCFTYPTLRDTLDAAHVSWRYYAPQTSDPSGVLFNAFASIAAVRCAAWHPLAEKCDGNGPEWTTNISTPEKNIFSDIAHGTLAQVSWVIPDWVNSDHSVDPPQNAAHYRFPVDYGPSWVASVVNAIGTSTYWKSTLIVVVWDDWGGFYDHVAPPQLDYQGLGFRVPMLLVSAHVKKGFIAHSQFEFGSILKCIEDNWGLKHLSIWDTRPQSICGGFPNFAVDPLDYAMPARAFVPIPAKFTKQFFLRQPPSGVPVDTE
ncbi:MAG: hypothetical protein JO277_10340 [Candidatus Eremiobacteraeota bacterium]|nr:hypothetical protein [Candidatus Eremiobacteraeota bacterium]